MNSYSNVSSDGTDNKTENVLFPHNFIFSRIRTLGEKQTMTFQTTQNSAEYIIDLRESKELLYLAGGTLAVR